MNHDDAKKVDGQILGITTDGWIRTIKTDNDGKLLVSGGGSGETKYPKTFVCEYITDEKTYEVNKFIDKIYIANFNETDAVKIKVDEEDAYIVAGNIALDIPVGKETSNIQIIADGDSVIKVQILIEIIE